MLNKCSVCGQTGKYGAKWQVVVEGDKNPPKLVHRPCGDNVLKHLPKGVNAKLMPSKELREEWKAKREEQQARNFWDAAFAKAETRKETSGKSGVVAAKKT
jgi:hypothetical protein